MSRAHFKTQKLAFLAITSLLSGTVIYRLIDFIVDKILCYLLNMESMTVADEFFMNYKAGKPPNVLGMITVDKFDFETMKMYLISKIEQTPRAKTKIVSLFGKHYVQYISQREWEI